MAKTARKLTPKQTVVEQIRRALRDVPYPGDDRICDGVTEEARKLGTEEAEVQAAFKGRHWAEVPLEVICRQHEGMFLFTPEAYRFYLPACMIAVLGVPGWTPELSLIAPRFSIEFSLVFTLTLPRPSDHQDFFLERVKAFTPEQKTAIRAFLQCLDRESGGSERTRKRLSDAARALQRYWENG